MDDFFLKVVINIIIGSAIIIGFFIYWGRNSGAFKEGGIVYEFLKNLKHKKHSDKSKNNNNSNN